MTAAVRAARVEDVVAMQAVERDAGERFRTVGLDRVADDAPYGTERLVGHVAAGAAWVADARGVVVGYAIASVVDGEAHLDQVSVREAWMGQGIGGALVERVSTWARAAGHRALTLTTYATVPWNGPWYARRGFVALAESSIGPELAAILVAERAAGLEPPARIAMRRSLRA